MSAASQRIHKPSPPRRPRHRPPRVGVVVSGALIVLLAACGGSATGPSTAASAPVAPPATDPGSGGVAPSGSTGGGAVGSDDGGAPGGNSAGDPTKGHANVAVTGGLTTTIDLPFAPLLALWESSGPGSAYLPFTDGDAVLFMTFSGSTLLVQYATTSTGVGMTSGATPCTFTTDELSGTAAKGSFSCKGMTLLQGETVGSAEMSGTFEAHK